MVVMSVWGRDWVAEVRVVAGRWESCLVVQGWEQVWCLVVRGRVGLLEREQGCLAMGTQVEEGGRLKG